MLRYAFINLSVFLSFIACSSFFVLRKVNLHAAWTYCSTGPLSQSTVALTYQNLSKPLHNRAFFLRFTHLSFEVMESVVSSQSPPHWRAHGTVDIVTNDVLSMSLYTTASHFALFRTLVPITGKTKQYKMCVIWNYTKRELLINVKRKCASLRQIRPSLC